MSIEKAIQCMSDTGVGQQLLNVSLEGMVHQKLFHDCDSVF